MDPSSTDSTVSSEKSAVRSIKNVYLNRQEAYDQRLSVVDRLFQCKTDVCQCASRSVRKSNFSINDSITSDNNSSSLTGVYGPYTYGQDSKAFEGNVLNHLVLNPRPISTVHKMKTEIDYCKCGGPAMQKETNPKSYNIQPSFNPRYTASENLEDLPFASFFQEQNESYQSQSNFLKFGNEIVYFTPDEVVVHNRPGDTWVSFLGNVYDLTPLIAKYIDTQEIKPLLAFAGKDISDWFDDNGEIRHYIHPITGVRVPYLPHGPIPDVQPNVPTPVWQPLCDYVNDEHKKKPWWRSTKYLIGKLTANARPIRIMNMLTSDECTINVCCEDKLSRILQRLSRFNSDATSYTFKFDTRVLDMDKTLDDNHIFDERKTFLENYLPEDIYIPAIQLYFNDDFQWDLDTSDECDD